MDTTKKERWLAALRGGEYTQNRDALCGVSDKSLCCIGVGVHCNGTSSRTISTMDSYQAADLLGLDEKSRTHLIDMNDGENGERPHSFEEIADWIEANL